MVVSAIRHAIPRQYWYPIFHFIAGVLNVTYSQSRISFISAGSYFDFNIMDMYLPHVQEQMMIKLSPDLVISDLFHKINVIMESEDSLMERHRHPNVVILLTDEVFLPSANDAEEFEIGLLSYILLIFIVDTTPESSTNNVARVMTEHNVTHYVYQLDDITHLGDLIPHVHSVLCVPTATQWHESVVYRPLRKEVNQDESSAGQSNQLHPTVVSGLTGSPGPAGHTGPAGPSGLIGSTGVTGPPGLAGYHGAAGQPGPRGHTGPQGPKGNKWDTGLWDHNTIVADMKGDKGQRGPTGRSGEMGLKGSMGVSGDTGVIGSMGMQGWQGAWGTKGDIGDIGNIGVVGDPGSMGPPGPMGVIYRYDWDECDDTNGTVCQHECLDMALGYKCGCHRGYVLMDDGLSCQDVNECFHNNGGCDQHCHNHDGYHVCSCQPGYVLSEDQRSCNDIDECCMEHAVCRGWQQCINTRGSYFCLDKSLIRLPVKKINFYASPVQNAGKIHDISWWDSLITDAFIISFMVWLALLSLLILLLMVLVITDKDKVLEALRAGRSHEDIMNASCTMDDPNHYFVLPRLSLPNLYTLNQTPISLCPNPSYAVAGYTPNVSRTSDPTPKSYQLVHEIGMDNDMIDETPESHHLLVPPNKCLARRVNYATDVQFKNN